MGAELQQKQAIVEDAVLDEHGRHQYMSTYCLHRQHNACRRTCKMCSAYCICECHDDHRPSGR